jgi:hypothetical protein
MTKYTLTVGLNDKITKTQLINTENAHEIIADTLLIDFDIYAFTMFECYGVYRHENGEIVKEKSFRIEIASDDVIDGKICEIIKSLKVKLNQESIMYERVNYANIQFI